MWGEKMLDLKITDVRVVPADSGFLVDDGTTSILYDSGFAFTGDELAQNVKRALKNRTLDYIFLTHSHYVHALGAAYVKRLYPSARVVAGEHATEIFAKPTAKSVMRDLDRKFALSCGVTDYEDLTDDLCVDIPVVDGDTIKTGGLTFTAITFPGHTRCSVGYYCHEKKLLLGSETTGVYVGDGVVMPLFLIGYKPTLESIAKMEALDIDYVLSPHYGILDAEQTKMYLKNAKSTTLEVVNNIKQILQNSGDKEKAVTYYKDKFFRGYVKTIYPLAALDLNTRIMVDLIAKELNSDG